MTTTLDKKQVMKDLESWASKLRKIDIEIKELYMELNEVYKAVQETE